MTLDQPASNAIVSPPGELLAALRRIPELALQDLSIARIFRLKGLSNLNYLVELPTGGLVVRLARPAPGSYANRDDEIAAARLAERLGLGPKLVFTDAASGLMVSEFVRRARLPGRNAAALSRMGAALGMLHRSGETLPGRYDIFAVIARYEALLLAKGRAQPDWPSTVKQRRATSEVLLKTSARPMAPCHNDPVPENFLELGDRALLIDWEYAGMNDPAFDLADLSLEVELTPDAEHTLLTAHGEAHTHDPLLPTFKFLICVMSALWGRLHEPGAGRQEWAKQREAMAAGFCA